MACIRRRETTRRIPRAAGATCRYRGIRHRRCAVTRVLPRNRPRDQCASIPQSIAREVFRARAQVRICRTGRRSRDFGGIAPRCSQAPPETAGTANCPLARRRKRRASEPWLAGLAAPPACSERSLHAPSMPSTGSRHRDWRWQSGAARKRFFGSSSWSGLSGGGRAWKSAAETHQLAAATVATGSHARRSAPAGAAVAGVHHGGRIASSQPQGRALGR